MPERIFSKVDLPEPLSPTSLKTLSFANSKLKFEKIYLSSNLYDKFAVLASKYAVITKIN